MKIKKVFFFICLGLVQTKLSSQDPEKRTLTTSPFVGVQVYSGLHLNLISSEVNKAVVYGSHADDVVLSMKNGRLQLKIALVSLSDTLPTRIDLYHSKRLDAIYGFQGSKITASQPIKQTSLNLKSSSGAVIDLAVYTDRLDIEALLGGRLNLEGAVTNVNLKVSLGGSCEAEKLQTNQIQTKLIGGGYAYISASELLDAQISGGSVLRVFGNPKKRVYQKKLGGKLYFEE
jgi:hypothetical protein